MATRIVSAPEAAWLNVVEELAGSPLIDSEIVPLKLPLVVAEIVNDAVAPRRTEAVAGVICSVNAGLALTVSVTVVVLLSVPLLPVMVRRNVPAAAVAVAVRASAAVPPATTLAGVNRALTPAGRAIREFGPERSVAAGEASSASSSTRPHATATAASGGFEQGARSGSSAPRATAVSSSSSRAASTAVGSAHAEREFGIG